MAPNPLTLGIVVGTFGLLFVRRIGDVPLDRAVTAAVGAVAVVAIGAISPSEAFESVHIDTLLLLFGMMVHVEALSMSGFYRWVGSTLVARVGTVRQLVLGTLLVAAGLSTVALNDATVLLLTPVLVGTIDRLDIDPTGPLLAVVFGANVGSVATPLGNPQNAYILSRSGLTTGEFVAALAPLGAICLVVAAVPLVALTRNHRLVQPTTDSPEFDERWALFSGGFLLGTLGLLLAVPSVSPGVIAAGVAIVHIAILQALRRVPGTEVIDRIDWGILVLFAGMFVLVGSLSGTVVETVLGRLDGPLALAGGTFVLSNVVSNVPAVILLAETTAGERGWLLLAAVSTLAGNATPIGSAATLIVLESAARRGVSLSVVRLIAVGAPIALVTSGIAVGWLLVI
ncbi:SLC13 family permease [Halalkalicoccus subterraneus]|uniref:SLC13 family permease n=1 Tax=Halalkalicoccus subterraneus TaxID=2675002 RepID=UPI000EFB07F3|nr:SLC13 family permease [Halalkalicoccus subterraneus]